MLCRVLMERLLLNILPGPVVAGVVGREKFIYDLWGDTVNLASRLTTDSHPSAIQCDARTHRLLAGDFHFDTPLRASLKGKGEVEVFRLLGRRSPPPRQDSDALAASGAA